MEKEAVFRFLSLYIPVEVVNEAGLAGIEYVLPDIIGEDNLTSEQEKKIKHIVKNYIEVVQNKDDYDDGRGKFYINILNVDKIIKVYFKTITTTPNLYNIKCLVKSSQGCFLKPSLRDEHNAMLYATEDMAASFAIYTSAYKVHQLLEQNTDNPSFLEKIDPPSFYEKLKKEEIIRLTKLLEGIKDDR